MVAGYQWDYEKKQTTKDCKNKYSRQCREKYVRESLFVGIRAKKTVSMLRDHIERIREDNIRVSTSGL